MSSLSQPFDSSLRPDPERRPAGDLLRTGRSQERAGRLDDALTSYQLAVQLAEQSSEQAVLVEVLRRLAVVHHRRNDQGLAGEFCRRSYREAVKLGDLVLAGEALNALAGFEFESGEIAAARGIYANALALAGTSAPLRARIEQNLGTLACIQGDYPAADDHYRRSLEAFEGADDERGAALAYHNLGMVATRRAQLDEAERCFEQSTKMASNTGDVHLEGLCQLNRAEVCHARQQFGDALRRAEAALGLFERLGDRRAKSDAYRVIGMVFRDTGRPALAEERLRSAIALSLETASVLGQAEATRELGRLHQSVGRNQEALTQLNAAHELFQRLDARVDLVDVTRKMADLEGAFLAVVRDWGQSIESADHYTFGHCERVAEYALAVAQALGLDAMQQTTIRLGAYLHDVGKVRVPHEVLNKPGRLTDEEFDLMKQHTVFGVELLAGVEFPWDIKPIIRWHHEKLDGTGYPDRLRGEQIPLAPQIIGIVDVFDALTTTRSYRKAMSRPEALNEMERCRTHWRPEVFAAFMASVGAATAQDAIVGAA
jgi:putative nucleotidyltransferase with HDIG domain